MTKFKFVLITCFLLSCASLFSAPLSNTELKAVVSGNSFSGHCSDTNRSFTVYFDPTGTVFIKKAGFKRYTYYGNWKIRNTLLITPWPIRDLGTSSDQRFNFYTERDLKVYKLELYQIQNNVYEPYRPRTCSCETFVPEAFPQCRWIKGRAKL